MDDKERKFAEPEMGTVTALSAYYALNNFKFNQAVDQDAFCFPLAVEHVAIKIAHMVDDYLANHSAEVDALLRKASSAYFTEVSPATLADMRQKFNDTVEASAQIFAKICWLWKTQNRVNATDARNKKLSPLFNNIKLWRNKINQNLEDTVAEYRLGEWSISNSDWSKKVLSHLDNICLAPELAETIYNLFGFAIQLQEPDDGTIRFVDFFPYDYIDWIPSAINFNTYVTNLDAEMAKIESAFNTYPFFDAMFAAMGMRYDTYAKRLDKRGKNTYLYDFTRTLAGDKTMVKLDTEAAIYDLVYSVGAASLDGSVPIVDDSSTKCVFSASKFNSVKVYDESIQYNQRVDITVESLVNALRGNVEIENIIAYRVDKDDEGAYNQSNIILNPFLITFSNTTEGVSQTRCINAMDMNNLVSMLDMPSASCTLLVNTIGQDDDITARHNYTYLGVSDYLISTQDIVSVVSDAVYEFFFAGRIDKFLKANGNIQTLSSDSSKR